MIITSCYDCNQSISQEESVQVIRYDKAVPKIRRVHNIRSECPDTESAVAKFIELNELDGAIQKARIQLHALEFRRDNEFLCIDQL